MLRTLKLRDFKRHKNIEVNFTPGLNLLIGGNYKGKSSILHGIRFLLGGYSAVPGGKAVAVNDEATNAAGELTWVMNGHEYHIERKGSNATLSQDGEPIAKGAKPVAAELEKLFGMDDGRFGQLKYSAQKQTESLLTLGTTKLHQIIEEISGADLVNKVADLCKVVETECQGGLAVLPETDPAALEKALAAKVTELQGLHETMTQAKAAAQVTGEEYEANRTSLQEVKDFNARMDALQQQRTQLADQLNQWRAAYNQALVSQESVEVGDLDAATAALAAAQAAISAYQGTAAKVNRINASIAGLEAEISKQAGRMEQLTAEVDEAEAALEGVDLDSARAKLNGLSANLGGTTRELAMAQQAAHSAVCPTCHRAMEGVDPAALEAKVQSLQQAVAALQAEQRQQATVVASIEQAINHHKKLFGDLSLLDSSVTSLRQQLAGAQEALGQAVYDGFEPGALPGLQHALAEAQEYRDQVQRATALAEAAAAQAAKAWVQVVSLQESLDALEEVQPVVPTEGLEAAVAKLKQALETTRYQVASAEEAYRREYAVWQRLGAEVEQAKASATQRASLAARMATAGQLRKFLLKNRDRYLSEVWQGVMARASSFASACTDGYIERIERTESGDFTYVEGGVVRPIEAGSGAQRSIMGLGVQLALSSLLPCPLDTLLLDEPTADADAQHSLAMATMLAGDGRQLILVSHRELDTAVAQNVIEVA